MILATSLTAFAQEKDDETIVLEEVEVNASLIQQMPTYTCTTIDSSAKFRNLSSNLAELLDEQPGLYIKKYGVSGTAVPSLRGTGSSHTQVYWNGFNINSPMLGQSDLSLIPVIAQDNILINYGGASLINGTGGLGGSILLNSKPTFKQNLSVNANLAYGSFSTLNGALSFTWSSPRFSWVTKVYGNDAKNDFSYTNIDKKEKRTENAESSQWGALQELYFKTSNTGFLFARAWAQQTDRNIQAPITVNFTDENLKNDFIRVNAGWEHAGRRSYTLVSGAYIQDELLYTYPTASVESKNLVDGFKLKLQRSQYLNKLRVNAGFDLSNDHANSDIYGSTQFQQRWSINASVLWEPIDRLNADFLLRYEQVDDQSSGILPSLSLVYQLNKKATWHLQAAANKNFRALTLNERYWTDASLEELQSEYSDNLEFSIRNTRKRQISSIDQRVTFFYAAVDNWIMWVPGMPAWKPKNIGEVESSGLEYSIAAKEITIGKLRFAAEGNYTFTHAVYVESNIENSLNKQLIFTPRHKGVVNLGVKYKGFSITFMEEMVGRRYTTSNNTEWLPPYYLSNLFLAQNFETPKLKGLVGFKIENLFGYHYQVIPFYAMPRQYAEVSLSIQWKK